MPVDSLRQELQASLGSAYALERGLGRLVPNAWWPRNSSATPRFAPSYPREAIRRHLRFHRTASGSPNALRQSGGRQVFVRPFPGPGGATQVSLEGGDHPVWGGDGRFVGYTMVNLTEGARLVVVTDWLAALRRTLAERQ